MKKFKTALCAVIVTYALSSVFHFMFNWIGEPFSLSFIFPVSESIFEHAKICVIPTMLGFYMFYKKDLTLSQTGVIGCIVAGLMIALYYFLKGALGISGLIIDLANLAICLFTATLFVPVIKKVSPKKCLIILITVLVLIAFLTHIHPVIPIFISEYHG